MASGEACSKIARRLVSLVLVLPVLLWFLTVVPFLCWPQLLSRERLRSGFDPAPEWFVSALKQLPRREFNATELEQLSVDGVVPVRGLVADDDVLAELRRLFTRKNVQTDTWHVNGVMNALVRHSPLPSIASSSLGGKPVAIWNSQVEPRPARSERVAQYPDSPWMDDVVAGWEGFPGQVTSMSLHDDVGGYPGLLHATGYPTVPLPSIFLALSDVQFGLRFIAGSHLLNERHRCPHGPLMSGRNACFERLWNESLGERTWDLRRGDAVLFWGATYHWTALTRLPRQALSIRYIPAELMYTGSGANRAGYADWMPPACSPLGGSAPHPVVHPPPSLAPGLDPSTGSQPGSPWPLFPQCPVGVGMVRFLRRRWDAYWDLHPECGAVGVVTSSDRA